MIDKRPADAARPASGAVTAPDADELDRPCVPPRVASTALFRGGRELLILHRGQEYRLRITRADKLILTK